MNLYTFSKKSWHVRFFKWLFKEDPTKRYKTMCPYFWTYVLVFIFILPILFLRICGNVGVKLLNKLRDYKELSTERIIAKFITRCSNPNLTPKEAYDIKNCKCWKKYRWDLSYEIENKVRELAYIESDRLYDEEIEKNRVKLNQKQIQKEYINKKVDYIKTNKSLVIIGKILLLVLILISVGGIGYGFWQLGTIIPWGDVGIMTLYVVSFLGIAGIFVLTVYSLFRYLLIPAFDYLTCIKYPSVNLKKLNFMLFPFKLIIRLFKVIGRTFAIIGSMIYSTYKKRCPIITWED